MGAIKLGSGKYKYKGYVITCHGYYEPDHCVWWEAVNIKTGCADYHTNTKKEIMELIDEDDTMEQKIIDEALSYCGLVGEPEIGFDEERRAYTLSDYYNGNAHYVKDLCGEDDVDNDVLIEKLNRVGIVYCL